MSLIRRQDLFTPLGEVLSIHVVYPCVTRQICPDDVEILHRARKSLAEDDLFGFCHPDLSENAVD